MHGRLHQVVFRGPPVAHGVGLICPKRIEHLRVAPLKGHRKHRHRRHHSGRSQRRKQQQSQVHPRGTAPRRPGTDRRRASLRGVPEARDHLQAPGGGLHFLSVVENTLHGLVAALHAARAHIVLAGRLARSQVRGDLTGLRTVCASREHGPAREVASCTLTVALGINLPGLEPQRMHVIEVPAQRVAVLHLRSSILRNGKVIIHSLPTKIQLASLAPTDAGPCPVAVAGHHVQGRENGVDTAILHADHVAAEGLGTRGGNEHQCSHNQTHHHS
mmetsp:Transcript_19947/g.48565  ORF Transcript_19947/g.48565 Transcript_19947/m.48565 type:complete len:273 (+) Transcript_19947:888-1706(+)